MAEAVLYCAEEELLLGGIGIKKEVDPNKYILDATNEIDSALGSRYETPFDLSDTSTMKRHSRLLIQRVACHLASGRLILAIALPGEDGRVNAYGLSLVTEATAAICAVAEGTVLLDYDSATQTEVLEKPSVPLIYNEDPESPVEAFYNRIGNPNYCYPSDRSLLRRPDRDGNGGNGQVL